MIRSYFAQMANRRRLERLKMRDETMRQRVNIREYKGRIYLVFDGWRIEDISALTAAEMVARVQHTRETVVKR